MGKEWDSFDDRTNEGRKDRIGNERAHISKGLTGYRAGLPFQEFSFNWASEAIRVLKPGGFMFAMGGTRTHHRLTCGIEDAGFMIRDELCWVYCQGFPKAQDLGMLIEKKLGGEGEVVGVDENFLARNPKNLHKDDYSESYGKPSYKDGAEAAIRKQPTTTEGKKWSGWKTPALKPAFEPIVVAQKPCDGSITENVMKNGVGGFNIDGCRIAFEDRADHTAAAAAARAHQQKRANTEGHNTIVLTPNGDSRVGRSPEAEYERYMTFVGRYPSNLLMQDECFGKLSKFFIIPKSGKTEKNEGCKQLPIQQTGHGNLQNSEGFECFDTNNNNHPTVKPIRLMEHLIKLTTKEGYTVIDPFLGSGTTGVAAANLGRKFIGIEKNEEYLKIAQARVGEAYKQGKLADYFTGNHPLPKEEKP